MCPLNLFKLYYLCLLPIDGSQIQNVFLNLIKKIFIKNKSLFLLACSMASSGIWI